MARQAHQIIHRVNLGISDQAVDHQPMLAGIDVVPTLMVALEMEAVRGDDSKQPLQWAKRDR